MKHVFVESNWVFLFGAPAHRRGKDAELLVQRAAAGELTLHLPSICLREGENAVRQKCQPTANKDLQFFRRWAVEADKLTVDQSAHATAFLEAYVAAMTSDLATLAARISGIASSPGVDVFALRDDMLERAISLRSEVPGLKPFDEAILAAVLVRAAEVSRAGATPIFFCDLDGDLVPWDRKGNRRPELAALYGGAGITFRDDFKVP